MISIIVSSHKEDDFLKFSSSLQSTIGVAYELIKIENSNQYSLSEAYNSGAQKAKFELLVFVHEDVTFNSSDWGITLINLFDQVPSLGIVGVAGALKKSQLPTGWGTGTAWFDRINLIQASDDGEEFQTTRKATEPMEPVKVIDGVFLATKKKIWEKVKFDEALDGYHLYDIDFSLRVTESYLGILSYEIVLTHYSKGNYQSEWVEKTLAYHHREDKKQLFDPDMSYASKSRRAWYKALTYGDISTSLRVEYLKQMGFDLRSCVHAFAFRFPFFGKRIFNLLSKIGL